MIPQAAASQRAENIERLILPARPEIVVAMFAKLRLTIREEVGEQLTQGHVKRLYVVVADGDPPP